MEELESEQRWTVLCLLGECMKEDNWNRSLMMVEAVSDLYLQEWISLSSSSAAATTATRSSGHFLATLIGSTLFLHSLSAMTDLLSVSLRQKTTILSHWVLFPIYHLYQTIQSSASAYTQIDARTATAVKSSSTNSSGFVRRRRGGTSSAATPSAVSAIETSCTNTPSHTGEVIGHACNTELQSFTGVLAQPGEESTVVHAGLVLISWFSSHHEEVLVKDLISMLIDLSKHKEHRTVRLTFFSNIPTMISSIGKENTFASLVIRMVTLLCNNSSYTGVMATSPLVAATCNHSLQVLLNTNSLSDQMKGRAIKILQNNTETNKQYFMSIEEDRSNLEEVMQSLQEKLIREVRNAEEYM